MSPSSDSSTSRSGADDTERAASNKRVSLIQPMGDSGFDATRVASRRVASRASARLPMTTHRAAVQ
jgi:hypothetical protein